MGDDWVWRSRLGQYHAELACFWFNVIETKGEGCGVAQDDTFPVRCGWSGVT